MHGLTFVLEKTVSVSALFGHAYYAIGTLTTEEKEEERGCFPISKRSFAQLSKGDFGDSYFINYNNSEKRLNRFEFRKEARKTKKEPHIKYAGGVLL